MGKIQEQGIVFYNRRLPRGWRTTSRSGQIYGSPRRASQELNITYWQVWLSHYYLPWTTPQVTNTWEDSWEKLYRRQLSHMFAIDLEKHGKWPEFEYLCLLTLTKVIPRLLGPLQSDGRNIKPCLLHGDCWDENTATDMETGEPFVFDAGSFYGHNEYETGNWRAPRHRLSSRVYMRNYKRNFPVSEPGEYINAWFRYLISNSSKCRGGLGCQKLTLLLTFQYRNSDLDTGLQPT